MTTQCELVTELRAKAQAYSSALAAVIAGPHCQSNPTDDICVEASNQKTATDTFIDQVLTPAVNQFCQGSEGG